LPAIDSHAQRLRVRQEKGETDDAAVVVAMTKADRHAACRRRTETGPRSVIWERRKPRRRLGSGRPPPRRESVRSASCRWDGRTEAADWTAARRSGRRPLRTNRTAPPGWNPRRCGVVRWMGWRPPRSEMILPAAIGPSLGWERSGPRRDWGSPGAAPSSGNGWDARKNRKASRAKGWKAIRWMEGENRSLWRRSADGWNPPRSGLIRRRRSGPRRPAWTGKTGPPAPKKPDAAPFGKKGTAAPGIPPG
jgi:hypothetical protein